MKITVVEVLLLIETDVVPLMVAPVGGYSVAELPLVFTTRNVSPESDAGSIAPPEPPVKSTLLEVIWRASVADEPAVVVDCVRPTIACA
jgi:hypothetical protein